MSAPPDPALAGDERDALEKGVAEFNAGRYFECHDTLEELWSGLRGPARDFFQGLIQVAVAQYHWSCDNHAGAESMMLRALGRFQRYPDRYCGFDLGGQRAWLDRALERVRRREEFGTPPAWTFDGLAAAEDATRPGSGSDDARGGRRSP